MRAFVLFLAGLAGVAAAGCGGADGVKVDGKVLKNGTPYPVGEGEGVTITLTSADGKLTCTSQGQPDGTFSVQKPGGGPIPAGKYKASYVYQLAADPYTKKKGLKYGKDLPEEWDVSPANTSFAVDIRQK